MFKQLATSFAIATMFAATPVLADDHDKEADNPEWKQKVNKNMDKDAHHNNSANHDMNDRADQDMKNSDDPDWKQKVNKNKDKSDAMQ